MARAGRHGAAAPVPALLRNIPALWSSGGAAVRAAGIAPVPEIDSFDTNALIDQALKG